MDTKKSGIYCLFETEPLYIWVTHVCEPINLKVIFYVSTFGFNRQMTDDSFNGLIIVKGESFELNFVIN